MDALGLVRLICETYKEESDNFLIVVGHFDKSVHLELVMDYQLPKFNQALEFKLGEFRRII